MRILHFLGNQITDIIEMVENIHDQGFDAIQINPIQPFKNDLIINEWYLSYQPLSFAIGNSYGTKDDLINLCNIAKSYDIKIIVDVICNHTANKSDVESLIPNNNVDPSLINNKYFWKEKKLITDWNNREQVTNYCMGLPDLRLDNYDLQNIIIDFLNSLIDCGVTGFRFDAAKSIALPEDISINHPRCDFWPRVISNLKSNNLYNYGEVLFADDELIKKYCKYINVLTNCYIEELPETITFVENHDSFLNTDAMGWTRKWTIDDVCSKYTNLTKIWPNTIFYNRLNSNMWMRKDVKDANLQCKISEKKLIKQKRI